MRCSKKAFDFLTCPDGENPESRALQPCGKILAFAVGSAVADCLLKSVLPNSKPTLALYGACALNMAQCVIGAYIQERITPGE